jgi:hypothetical protein
MFYLPCADQVLLFVDDVKDHDTKSCMIQVSRYLLYRVTGPLVLIESVSAMNEDSD